MQLFIQFSILLVLMIMGLQDFRYRAISWYAFPLLAVLMLLGNKDFNITEVYVNISFLLINFGLATLIISLKNKRVTNLLKSHIGWGDLLMLVCLSLYFSPLSFFVFYLSSLLFIATATGIYMLLAKPKNYTIPLAGMQGLLLFVCILSASLFDVKINTIKWFENYFL